MNVPIEILPSGALSRCRSRCARRGVTIMEVMFAIAIVIVGLLYVSSLVPVAMHFARDTMRLDEAVQSAASASAVVNAEELADFERLVIYNDDLTDPAGSGVLGLRLVRGERFFASPGPPNSPNTAFWAFPAYYSNWQTPTATANAVGQFPPGPPPGAVDSPGFRRLIADPYNAPPTAGVFYVDVRRYGGFCIDPTLIPDEMLVPGIGNSASGNAYRYGVFPYYRPHWNPLTDPAESMGTSSQNLGFPMPRLWRCTLTRNNVQTGNAVLFTQVMDPTTEAGTFLLPGNVIRQEAKDKSTPTTRLFSSFSGGGSPIPVTSSHVNRYSWMATLIPGKNHEPVYTLSTVIIENRGREDLSMFDATVATPATPPDQRPSEERVGWITGAVGFQGGGGGDVEVIGSRNVLDRIRPGNWVMLSRQRYSGESATAEPTTADIPLGPTSHGWYRVVSVSPAITNGATTFTAPTPSGDYWVRTVTLDGSDWDFGLVSAVSPNNFFPNDTVMTIVDGAVEVIQTQVILE